MKRIITIILAVALSVILCSCGNMGMGAGNYNYTHLYVDTYHHADCYTIIKWYDNETGIEVKTKEAGYMFLSEGTYVLMVDSSECPFCDESDS